MGEDIPQDEYFEWEDIISYNPPPPTSIAKPTRKPVNLDISAFPAMPTFDDMRDDLFDYESDSEMETGLQVGGGPRLSRSLSAQSISTMTFKSLGASHEEDPISMPSYEETKSLVASLSTASLTSLGSSQPTEPEHVERAEDDTAVLATPSKHVDFLSHEWTEDELFATWKYLKAKSSRKVYNNSTRLINASWRLWMKERYQLETTEPKSINWQKDRDTTWLYGPLHPGAITPSEPCSAAMSRSSSLPTRSSSPIRPILKKPTLSETLLRRSISSAALVRQAALAAEEAQNFSQKNRNTSLPSELYNQVRKSLVSSGLRRTNSSKSVRFHDDLEESIEPCPTHMRIESIFEVSSEETSEDEEEQSENLSPKSFLTILKSQSSISHLDLNQDNSSSSDSLQESMTSDASSDSDEEAAEDYFGGLVRHGQATGLHTNSSSTRETLLLDPSMVRDEFALPIVGEEKVKPWVEQASLGEKYPEWHNQVDVDEADWWEGV